jgi:hypothetical protein
MLNFAKYLHKTKIHLRFDQMVKLISLIVWLD